MVLALGCITPLAGHTNTTIYWINPGGGQLSDAANWVAAECRASPTRRFSIADGDFGPLFISFSSYFPYTAQDPLRYELFILQAEFARTQVFDRPFSGRHFFEEVIGENADLARPEQMSLVFT